MKPLTLAVVFMLWRGISAATLCAAPIPAEELFRASPVSEARLSADGRHVAGIVADEKDKQSLLIVDLAGGPPLAVRGRGVFDMASFEWMTNNRLLFAVTEDKRYSMGLYSVTLDNIEGYYPIDNRDVIRVIGIPESRPGKVLTWITEQANTHGSELVELNADHHFSGREVWQMGAIISDAYGGPTTGGVVSDIQADRDGRLAICAVWANGHTCTYRFDFDKRAWSQIPIADWAVPMGMDFDQGYVWVVTMSKEGGYALRRCNVSSGAVEPPVLLDPTYDLSQGVLHFSTKQAALAGIVYAGRRYKSAWFLPNYQMAQGIMDRLHPDTDNLLVNADDEETKFLFDLVSSNRHQAFVILDLQAKRLISPFGLVVSPDPAYRRSQPIRFRARDGVWLEGYITLPAQASRSHPVPMVVLVHGGPFLRDLPVFDPEVQFLVSRGYAVLQPNYRGSTGYSPEISHDREFDFARANRDVTDATIASLHSGLIDPTRIAIMGASFGGYLAVSGVAFEQKLYRCAITLCGVFDWGEEIDFSTYEKPGVSVMLREGFQQVGLSRNTLGQISPIDAADRISVPVLIAHGEDDHLVSARQSHELAHELKHRGIPCETYFRPFAGHGFFGYSDRMGYYRRVEAFLAKYLGGASLTPAQ